MIIIWRGTRRACEAIRDELDCQRVYSIMGYEPNPQLPGWDWILHVRQEDDIRARDIRDFVLMEIGQGTRQ